MQQLKPLAAALVAAGGLTMVAQEALAFEITPRGRIHMDYAIHDEDGQELGDGFQVRRTRMGLTGTIDENWRFQVEYDFAENGSSANDVWLRYTGLQHGHITIGHFKVPFGLEEITSSNSITLIERSLPTTTFAQARRVGVGYSVTQSNWHFAAMGFGQGSGSGTRSTTGDEGLGVGARFVFNPVRNDDLMVHLGIAASTEEPADDNVEQVRFRTRPESRPTDVRLVDTGNIGGTRRIDQVGLEAAMQSGPFSLQGEWMRADVNRRGIEPDVDFSGWYVSGSWVVTGESRGYRDGVFRGVSPSGPGGAWELTARVSNVNLNDGAVAGGKQDNITLGVNWYANSNVRFMANYIINDVERGGVNDKPNIFLMRAQVAF